jgi:hypothetical protein
MHATGLIGQDNDGEHGIVISAGKAPPLTRFEFKPMFATGLGK